VNTFVIDASIAVKWVVEEDGTPEALALRQTAKLMAPELLVAECANIFWKKVRRKHFSPPAFSRAPRSNYCQCELYWKLRHEYQSKSTIPLTIVCILVWL
jgi:hypothetical protein